MSVLAFEPVAPAAVTARGPTALALGSATCSVMKSPPLPPFADGSYRGAADCWIVVPLNVTVVGEPDGDTKFRPRSSTEPGASIGMVTSCPAEFGPTAKPRLVADTTGGSTTATLPGMANGARERKLVSSTVLIANDVREVER